jgi:hypothetical protein
MSKEGQPILDENWKRISKVYDFILSQPRAEKKTEPSAEEKPVTPNPEEQVEWKQEALIPMEQTIFEPIPKKSGVRRKVHNLSRTSP